LRINVTCTRKKRQAVLRKGWGRSVDSVETTVIDLNLRTGPEAQMEGTEDNRPLKVVSGGGALEEQGTSHQLPES